MLRYKSRVPTDIQISFHGPDASGFLTSLHESMTGTRHAQRRKRSLPIVLTLRVLMFATFRSSEFSSRSVKKRIIT